MNPPTHARITPGRRLPHGATLDGAGVNFSLFSRHATAAELLLYESAEADAPAETLLLDPVTHRTQFTWHLHVAGLRAGAFYAWRLDGPQDTAVTGMRFNPLKELVDPHARAVSDRRHDRLLASDPWAGGSHLPRSLVAAPLSGDAGPQWTPRGLDGAVIYELHVGSFTSHPSSGVEHPGTFAGVVEKIPHLTALGVTHVELLPVQAFDVQDVPAGTRALGLGNAWGYSTYGFFAPHPRYCVERDGPAAAQEFRDMVDALHRAGIGVLLDVVPNHSAEGGDHGPWISFKGIANEAFYHLDPADRRRYLDFSGCGNSLNCNHPIVADFLQASFEWWAREMRVDGFRVDLASVLTRGEDGAPLANPPLPWRLDLSPALADRVLIAEPWDAAGLTHAGSFPGLRWAEWNGGYRDVLRRFARGDDGVAGAVAAFMTGSADLFSASGRGPQSSVNAVACHDGFTLRDTVSYARKHNEANGEGNRDGRDDEPSFHCGAEGETSDPEVIALRLKSARNLLSMLMLSLGTPMILSGDEMLRTQGGNSNAWCQDNGVSWLDWGLATEHAAFLRFTREIIALRKRHRLLARNRFFTGQAIPARGLPDIAWHGLMLGRPPWKGGDPRVLASTLAGADDSEPDLHVVLNMSDREGLAELPETRGRRWFLAVDTSRASPGDIVEPARQEPAGITPVRVEPRSVVVLEGRG